MNLLGAAAHLQGQGVPYEQAQQMMAERRQKEELAKLQALDEQRKKALFSDNRLALGYLKNGDVESVKKLGANRIDNIRRLGGDPVHTEQLLQRIESGEPAESLISDMQTLDDQAVAYGYLEAPVQAEPDDLTLDIQKETRAEIRKNFGKISEEVKAIKTNYGKIESLSKQVSKNNRTAVAQLMTALVKLGDPGSIVNTAEMENALNAQNPVAYLADKGVDSSIINTIMQKIDPLNPGNVNVDEVKATARALVSSNVPDLMSRYQMEVKRGEQNLSGRGFQSVYSEGLDQRVKSLNDLLPKEEPKPKTGGITGFKIIGIE